MKKLMMKKSVDILQENTTPNHRALLDFSGSTGCLVGAIPANNKWYQKSVELYAYLPMSGRHRPTDTFAGGDWHCGRWAECC